MNNFYHEKINENNNKENINKIGINISKIYDQNGNDILTLKDIKYKIFSNKEMTIFEENKYMMYCKKNDENNYLFFLFDYPINISYIELKPFYEEDKEDNYYNSAKDMKIFCDTSVIFKGRLYNKQPTIILFTSNEKILGNINTNYLTKPEINRDFIQHKTDEYFSMTFN